MSDPQREIKRLIKLSQHVYALKAIFGLNIYPSEKPIVYIFLGECCFQHFLGSEQKGQLCKREI